jgi:hypothetical protein
MSWPNQDTIPDFLWSDWRKSWQTSVTIAAAPVEIRTKDFSNESVTAMLIRSVFSQSSCLQLYCVSDSDSVTTLLQKFVHVMDPSFLKPPPHPQEPVVHSEPSVCPLSKQPLSGLQILPPPSPCSYWLAQSSSAVPPYHSSTAVQLFYPEDGSSMYLRNFSNDVPDYIHLLLYPEDRGKMFLRNAQRSTTSHITLQPWR